MRCTDSTNTTCTACETPFFSLRSDNQCYPTPSEKIQVASKAFRDDTSQARITFTHTLDEDIDTSKITVSLFEENQTTELSIKVDKIELQNKKSILISLTPDATEIENGVLKVTFKNRTNIRSPDNPLVFFTEKVVEISPVDYFRPEKEQERLRAFSVGFNLGLKFLFWLALLVSLSTAYTLLKIIQMVDFMILFNTQHPSNLKTFLSLVSSSILDSIPNLMEFLSDTKLCSLQKSRFLDEDVSCEIFYNIGNYFIFVAILISLSLIVNFLHKIITCESLNNRLKKWVDYFRLIFWLDTMEAVQLDVYLNFFITITEVDFSNQILLLNYTTSFFIGLCYILTHFALVYLTTQARKAIKADQENKKKSLNRLKNRLERNRGLRNFMQQSQRISNKDRGNPRPLHQLDDGLEKEDDSNGLTKFKKYEMLFEDYKKDSFFQVNYRSFASYRDFLIVFCLVILHDFSIFQILEATLIGICSTALEFVYRPQSEFKENLAEQIKGVLYSLCTLCFLFLALLQDKWKRKRLYYALGYPVIILIILIFTTAVAKDGYDYYLYFKEKCCPKKLPRITRKKGSWVKWKRNKERSKPRERESEQKRFVVDNQPHQPISYQPKPLIREQEEAVDSHFESSLDLSKKNLEKLSQNGSDGEEEKIADFDQKRNKMTNRRAKFQNAKHMNRRKKRGVATNMILGDSPVSRQRFRRQQKRFMSEVNQID